MTGHPFRGVFGSGANPECDREIRSRRVRKDTPERDCGRKSMVLPNGKATSDSRGPAAHHGGLTVHAAQAAEAVALQRRRAPARAGAGWGEDDLGRGMKTQGRSESRPSRKARRGFGTRRRSKASRPSKSRRTSRERGLATVHGAGESRTRRCPDGTTAQVVAKSGVSLGVEQGGAGVARFQSPASSEAGAPGSIHWPFVRRASARLEGDGGCGGPGNRPEHPHSRRDAVAVLP